MTLVPGFWCPVREYGWLPDSPTGCTDESHHHAQSERNVAQPEHSVIASWSAPDSITSQREGEG